MPDFGLGHLKARREATRKVGAVGVRRPVRAHNAEGVRAARTHGAEPPDAGARRCRVLVLDLAITVLVIVVLLLVVRLGAVGVASRTLDLHLTQQPDFIRGRGHVARGVGAAARVVAVLRAGRDDVPPGRRQGRQERRADGLAHIAVVPSAGVGVAGVHAEARAGRAVAVHERDVHTSRRLAELEVDAVSALHAAVVVEAQDEGVHGVVIAQSSERAIDRDTHLVAHAPIVRRLAGLGRRRDDVRRVVRQARIGQADRHVDGLVAGRGVVGARRHLHGDLGGARLEAGDLHAGAAHLHPCRGGVAGCGADHAVARAGHGHALRQRGDVQRHAALCQRQTARRLADGPGHALGAGAAVGPLVVGLRREGRGIASRVGGGARPADGQLIAVVVAPLGRLCASRVGQRPALRGYGQAGLADRPCHALGGLGAVGPLVALLGREGRNVAACVGAAGRSADGQLLRVVPVPRGGLCRARVRQDARLGGYAVDHAGQLGHGFQRVVRRLLRVARRSLGLVGRSLSGATPYNRSPGKASSNKVGDLPEAPGSDRQTRPSGEKPPTYASGLAFLPSG